MKPKAKTRALPSANAAESAHLEACRAWERRILQANGKSSPEHGAQLSLELARQMVSPDRRDTVSPFITLGDAGLNGLLGPQRRLKSRGGTTTKRPLPRLHILSDLHLESGAYEIDPRIEFDILVAAGDIGPLEIAIPWLARVGKPVVYVLGNHEYWGQSLQGAVERAKQLAQGTSVTVLNREKAVIGGVEFLGATLWTDLFALQPTFVHAVGRFMLDYGMIDGTTWIEQPRNLRAFKRAHEQFIRAEQRGDEPPGPSRAERAKRKALLKRDPYFKPGHALSERLRYLRVTAESNSPVLPEGRLRCDPLMTYVEHQRTRAWLRRELANAPARGRCRVVVTHHAPTLQALHLQGHRERLKQERWGMNDNTPALLAGYASAVLEDTDWPPYALSTVGLWVHGHTHRGMRYLHGTATDFEQHYGLGRAALPVVCNPRGQRLEPLTPEKAKTMALLGYRFTDEDVDASQERYAAEPYRGTARGFDPQFCVELSAPARPVLCESAAAPVQDMEALVEELIRTLDAVCRGTPAQRHCSNNWFEQVLRDFNQASRSLNRTVIQAQGFSVSGSILDKMPILKDVHLSASGPWDFDQPRPEPSRVDYARSVALARQTVMRARCSPWLSAHYWAQWTMVALQSVQCLAEAGIEARVWPVTPAQLRLAHFEVHHDLVDVRVVVRGTPFEARDHRQPSLSNKSNPTEEGCDLFSKVRDLLWSSLNPQAGLRGWRPRFDVAENEQQWKRARRISLGQSHLAQVLTHLNRLEVA